MRKKHERHFHIFCFLALVSLSSPLAWAGATPSAADDSGGVWVSQSDGAESCAPGSGSDLDKGAEVLKQAKIPILKSQKGHDKKMHSQVCGAPQGSENAYLIPKEYLSDAILHGYQLKK